MIIKIRQKFIKKTENNKIKNIENNKINMNYRQTYYRLDTSCY
jgi:hypothetical protein